MKKKEVKKEAIKLPVEKAKVEKVEVKQGDKPPVTFQEHLDTGWVSLNASESLQKAGRKVAEIKNIEGKILHKIKE